MFGGATGETGATDVGTDGEEVGASHCGKLGRGKPASWLLKVGATGVEVIGSDEAVG